MERLEAYVRLLEAHQHAPPPDLASAPNRRLRLLSASFRVRLKTLATTAARPLARRRAHQLVHNSVVRLHLGSGGMRLSGWVNVDLVGQPADLPWDLRHPLPVPDGSVDAVFHEHLLEHLPIGAGLSLLKESHRVLRSNGILRIGVPDFERYVRAYLRPDGYIEANRPGRPTPLLAVAEVIYGYQHRSVWDGPTLRLALEETGFTDVSVRSFADSAILPAPDSQHRAAETLYVEGRRS